MSRRVFCLIRGALTLAVALFPAGGLASQLPAVATLTGVSPAFATLFGANTNWTARAEVRILDRDRQEWARLPLEAAMLGQNIRFDLDLGQIKSKELPELAISGLKQAGLTEVVSVVRADRKATYVLYPAVRSYLNLPLDAEEVEALAQGYRADRKVLGNEAVDGRACVKHRLTVSGPQGVALEATTWNAADLRDFPLQVETRELERTMFLKFTDVQFAAPARQRFDLPSGYTEYRDPQAMVLGIMRQMVSASGKEKNQAR